MSSFCPSNSMTFHGEPLQQLAIVNLLCGDGSKEVGYKSISL
jgi:hypothetical protein